MSGSLLSQFARHQQRVLAFVSEDGAEHYQQQFHPDLSPSGWHLGHCVFTENYWIREVIEQQPIDDRDRSLYVPELAYKPARGNQLPAFRELLAWARRQQRENAKRFSALLNDKCRHPLLRAGYLGVFLVQHYAQHYETLCQIRAQRQLQRCPPLQVRRPLTAAQPVSDRVELPAGRYPIGQHRRHRPYDNEYPGHRVTVSGCRLARRPATNAEYLAFMQAGGYRQRRWWSDAGWRWLRDTGVEHPCYWRRNEAGHWYAIGPAGAFALRPVAAVCGLSYYEAQAYAAWAGGRLPHEHEWEAAARSGRLQGRGQVWEWCDNAFYPYPGFTPYPYDGYSLPYFDGAHFVLKGGSRHSCRVIKRPSFRNYYEADKRHIFAGVRPAFD